MPKMKKIVLFDFDGVIVDTFDICYAINVKTHKQLTKNEFRDFFMGNIYEAEENPPLGFRSTFVQIPSS